ncbi:hypothetical protein IB62_012740 [Xanthomonas euvesicatoria]|nr:hypothetical protein IB62_012740 [Xanthomonas euvesicatoria]
MAGSPLQNVCAIIGSRHAGHKNAGKGKSRTHGKAAHPGHRTALGQALCPASDAMLTWGAAPK